MKLALGHQFKNVELGLYGIVTHAFKLDGGLVCQAMVLQTRRRPRKVVMNVTCSLLASEKAKRHSFLKIRMNGGNAEVSLPPLSRP